MEYDNLLLDFLDDIKEYIKEATHNTDVDDAYITTSLPKKGAIRVQCVNNYVVSRTEDFLNNNSEFVALQIYCYNGQNSTSKSNSMISTLKLVGNIKSLFDKSTIKNNNNNVISARIVGTSPALPVKEGSQLYVSSLRLEFTVGNPYKKIYKGE